MERILVPTDGSPLSEAAIPTAMTLAHAQGARVSLVRVVAPSVWTTQEPDGYLSGDMTEEVLEAIEENAQEELGRAAQQLRAGGVEVETYLRRGSVAANLLGLEAKVRPELVVMATHGRTGLARLALGSVADMMVREGTVPVLLVRSFHPPQGQLETALVPLDGSALAEEALPMVEMLAGKPLRHVHLLRAVASADKEARAVAYLEQVAERLQAVGLTTQLTVETEDPADAIAQRGKKADLVILSTHGRGGFDRLRHGSVAEQGTHNLTTPTLLVRAGLAGQGEPNVAAAAHAPA